MLKVPIGLHQHNTLYCRLHWHGVNIKDAMRMRWKLEQGNHLWLSALHCTYSYHHCISIGPLHPFVYLCTFVHIIVCSEIVCYAIA